MALIDDSKEIGLAHVAGLKKAAREQLLGLPPDEAQALVERILHPRLWRIADPGQLAWPGDLADDLLPDEPEP